MPNIPDEIVPIVFQKYNGNFEAVDFTLNIDNPYEVTQLIEVARKEAGVKGCWVVIQMALIPGEYFFEKTEQEQIGEVTDDGTKPE